MRGISVRTKWNRLVAAVTLAMLTVPVGTAADTSGSDARAVQIAESTLQAMGGRAAWDATRFVSWHFFGGRRHWWDRQTGDIRIEADESVILMNIDTRRGRVWNAGAELPPGPELDEALLQGHQWWVNDSYWMFMPYKLLDPGVTLKYVGEKPTADGRPADVLELTFVEVGYTPENKYEVWVVRESGLIEQWAFYAEAGETEPNFVMPWGDWKPFGRIKLATSHGRDRDWRIAVHDTLARSVFEDPAPVGN